MTIFSNFLNYITKDKTIRQVISKAKSYYIVLNPGYLSSIGIKNPNDLLTVAKGMLIPGSITIKNDLLYFHSEEIDNLPIAKAAAASLVKVATIIPGHSGNINVRPAKSSELLRNTATVNYVVNVTSDKGKDVINIRQKAVGMTVSAWKAHKDLLGKALNKVQGMQAIIGRRINYMSNALANIFNRAPGKLTPKTKGKPSVPKGHNASKSIKINTDIKYTNLEETALHWEMEESTTFLENLFFLMNSRIAGAVKDNMGKGFSSDILNFQTGRFNESVDITSIVAVRPDHLTMYYSYMRYPYATFDPGGKHHNLNSDRKGPSEIIDQSIRELAAQLIFDRYAVTPMPSYHG